MKPSGVMNGRLAISVQENGEEIVFTTETLMWKPAQEKALLPLERGLVRWVHETAAWWLLDSGVRYLMDMCCPIYSKSR